MATWQERALRHVNRDPERRSGGLRFPLLLSVALFALVLPLLLLAMDGSGSTPSSATVTIDAVEDESVALTAEGQLAQSGAHIPAGAEAFSHEALLSLLRAAGWPEEALADAVAVSGCESSWYPGAVGTVGELGIFQVHPVHFPRFEERWGASAHPANPLQNAIIAHEIWAEQGWEPWTCAPQR